MRIFVLGIVVGAMGCATVQPFVPSRVQQTAFDEVVRQAEAAGVEDGPHEAAAMLADAKSDWTYAQHLPKYPERARQMATQAQREAEAALRMAHRTLQAAAPMPAAAPPPPAPLPIAAPRGVASGRPDR